MLSLFLLLGCGGETGFSTEANDPGASVGDAGIEIEPTSLIFMQAEAGILYAQDVILRSIGDEPLTVYSVQIQDDVSASFEIGNGVGAETITIEPDREDSFLVHLFMVTADAPAYATVALQTNDADNLTVHIPVEAYPLGWFGGDTGDTGDTGP